MLESTALLSKMEIILSQEEEKEKEEEESEGAPVLTTKVRLKWGDGVGRWRRGRNRLNIAHIG